MQVPITPNLKPTQAGRSVLGQALNGTEQETFKGYVNQLYIALGGKIGGTKHSAWKTLLSMITFVDEVEALKMEKGSKTYFPSAKELDEAKKEDYRVWNKWCAENTVYTSTFRLEYENRTYTKLDVWQFFRRIQNGIACCKTSDVGLTLHSLQTDVHALLHGWGVFSIRQ